MENIDISNRAKLQLRILQMKTEKLNNEAQLNQSFKELTYLFFTPTFTNEETNNEPQSNKRMFLDLSKMVLNRTTNYILEQKFGQKRSFNNFLTSMFMEFVSIPLISKKITTLFSEIRNQVFDESEENDSQ